MDKKLHNRNQRSGIYFFVFQSFKMKPLNSQFGVQTLNSVLRGIKLIWHIVWPQVWFVCSKYLLIRPIKRILTICIHMFRSQCCRSASIRDKNWRNWPRLKSQGDLNFGSRSLNNPTHKSVTLTSLDYTVTIFTSDFLAFSLNLNKKVR